MIERDPCSLWNILLKYSDGYHLWGGTRQRKGMRKKRGRRSGMEEVKIVGNIVIWAHFYKCHQRQSAPFHIQRSRAKVFAEAHLSKADTVAVRFNLCRASANRAAGSRWRNRHFDQRNMLR
ncbi:hypothetical protein T10_11532 [Trichinella papuae]|uniref:Uncharacterized protein n=1 Tax=Trichinella papuae TaxID=268474 RepID=A0A0V1MMW7_9BILA|nr:hypothetical protein T10_11532 [Trichinella papuae]